MRAGGAARAGLGVALLFAVALGARLVNLPFVFVDGVFAPPAAADEYYHLRRIAWSVEHFPSLIDFDRSVNHPAGAQIVWPPGWDWSLAAVARALAGPDDPVAAERVLAWIPPLLGACTALGVLWLAWRRFGALAGWLSGAYLALMPVSQLQSRAGKIDHQVGESVLAPWLYGAAMAVLVERDRRRRWAAAGLGVAMVALILVWTGGLLHWIVIEAVLVLRLLAVRERAEARALAEALALSHGLAALLVLPFCVGHAWAEWGPFSPLVLSGFQPTWLAAGALTGAALALLWRRDALGATRARRAGLALALGAAGVALALLLLPGLGGALDVAAGWFEKREDFQTHVLELSPLFRPRGAWRIDLALAFFTPAALLLPIAVAALAWRVARGREEAGAWLLLAWVTACFAATATQLRFNVSLAVPLAIAIGWLASRVAGHWPARPRWAGLAVSAALLLAALPTLIPFYAVQLADLRAGKQTLYEGEARVPGTLAVGLWMRRHLPPSPAFADPLADPGEGVLALWGIGHVLRWTGHQSMVQDNFGVYGGRASYDAAEAYFSATDEDAALAIARALHAGYVVVDGRGSGHGPPSPPDALTPRLANARGARVYVSDPAAGTSRELPALGHHRLLYESPATLPDSLRLQPGAPPPPGLKLYQLVEGAIIEGTASPGASVVALLPLRVGDARFVWRAGARADADGRYALRVPYATGANGPDVRAEGRYELVSARAHGEVEVAEEAVLRGLVVPGPDLASAPEAAAAGDAGAAP